MLHALLLLSELAYRLEPSFSIDRLVKALLAQQLQTMHKQGKSEYVNMTACKSEFNNM